MLFHGFEFVGGERPVFLENVIGNADLADVVQRRGLEQQFDAFVRQFVFESRMMLQCHRQRFHIALRAIDMISRFVVTRFRKCRHRGDRGILNFRQFLRALSHHVFQMLVVRHQRTLRIHQFEMPWQYARARPAAKSAW